jgi:hypothetical protein
MKIRKDLVKSPKKKKKNRSNYLNKDTDILFYNDNSKNKSRTIGILKNGNNANLKSIQIDGFNYVLTNTYTFDSIVHLICTSYVDSLQYSMYIEREKKK